MHATPPTSPPPPPPPTTATGNASGPETEPPNRVQPKRMAKHPPPPSIDRAPNSHQPSQPPLIALAYGKCNKNYSATTGGHVLDGCGEFMPSLTSTPTDPNFLICDACGCHRSFHRETELYYPPMHHVIEYQTPQTSPPSHSPSPSPISSSYYPTAPHIFFAGLQPVANHNAKRRFRSKFSNDQKEKMQEFAERIGWKMSKKDNEMILGFCREVGVTKRVFKVWMHNHKNTSVKNNHPDLN